MGTRKKTITLAEWINELGATEVGRLLKVDPSSARQWRRGYVLPTRQTQLLIEKYSRGSIDFGREAKRFYSATNKKRWNA